MDIENFENIKKKIDYAKLEGIIPEEVQVVFFENADQAIEAIRSNKIPGIKWDQSCEDKWTDLLKIKEEKEN
jgi:hypothetical protein